ncbi:hypothetical protein ElyMa_000644400 [Elysia marginata]|uniref:Uncharacterized protein n=1 Tax=Elysia marginata TaxID=1093978 RepID=A0AAV4GBX1_9GAST|nr:hypothetical protein ElyMa_000644400 [Elysia marginata]
MASSDVSEIHEPRANCYGSPNARFSLCWFRKQPGRRMPELHAMIAANIRESEQGNVQNMRQPGTTVKRRDLTVIQKREADSNRDMAIQAYRLMKKKIKQ